VSGINPFDPERDPALGALLRDALAGRDEEGFLARVRASVALTRQERTFDVLARWLRPNVAAAAAIVLIGAALWWYEEAGRSATTATVAEVLLAGLLEVR